MPSPTSSLATLRPDLATFYEFDLEAERAGYIASQVFPVIDVASQSGTYGKIPLKELLEERETKRAPGSGYSRSEFEFDTATYACVEHGAEEPVDDREAKMYAEYFDAEVVSTARASAAVLRNAEKRIADAVFNTTTWTGSSLTTAVTNEWDDSANATPIVDVEAAVQKIYDNSGLWANALVVNRKVFRNLRNCDSIIDRINSAGAGSPSKASDVTVEMLSQVFDLDYILVAGGTRNTANEGQTASPGQIWSGEYAMICKVAASLDMREPCIGRTVSLVPRTGRALVVQSRRIEMKTSEAMLFEFDTMSMKIVLYPEAGHLLSNITT